MWTHELAILLGTAVTIAVLHTLLGPDHYLPFVAMAKARQWPMVKTILVTILCGIGHVGSSVVLGLIGIAAGIGVSHLEGVESVRGNLAAWLLLSFGLVYTVWGIRRAIRNKPHAHVHVHADGANHVHKHTHADQHTHVHSAPDPRSVTPWVLFVIFVFGPCEPLIPLLMYPAATDGGVAATCLVALTFSLFTIGTMTAVVVALSYGLQFVSLRPLERYTHALAGATVTLCGVAILLGL